MASTQSAAAGVPEAAFEEDPMAKVKRARAKLNVDKQKTTSVQSKAKGMCNGIEAHSKLFPAPNPPISDIRDQIVVVDDAEVLVDTNVKGAAAARNVQRSILVGMLECELTYVQSVADKSDTNEQAVSTIEAAGLEVATVPQRNSAILTVKQGPTAGSAMLDAYAAKLAGGKAKTFYNWQYTADGGATFVNLPSTPKSKTMVANLDVLRTYGFRVCVTNPDGIAGAWSQVVTFLVQ